MPGKYLLLCTSRLDVGTGVSAHQELKTSQVWTDWTKGDNRRVIAIMDKLKDRTRYPQLRLCCTASMLWVATGKIEGYVHDAPESFDFAAASLIVERQGGMVTDIEGRPWTPFSKSIVATNGLIHNDLLSILH